MSDFTVMRAGDAPDYTKGSDSPFLGYGKPMGSEQVAFNVRVLAPGTSNVPPGFDADGGHSHDTTEEIYFVLDGEVDVKVEDEIVTLKARDAVLIPPTAKRSYRNNSDAEAAVAMISIPMKDPMAESHLHEGFWPG
jgi:mannose-6-phosphate isomerase-like protein (cupin superfamily)